MNGRVLTAILALSLTTLAQAQDAKPAPAPESKVLVLRGKLHVGDGTVHADGGVIVKDGKILAAGPWKSLSFPEGARVAAPKGAELSPGLIEPSGSAGIRESVYAEHSSEIVPHLRVMDAVDRRHTSFRALTKRGVTSVYLPSDPASVVGSQGCLLKTGGARSVITAAGGIKATLGSATWRRGASNRPPWGQPSHLTRRPNTLMGNVWVFRDAFAQSRLATQPTPAQAILKEVLAGKRPLRIQAHMRGEIETAFRLAAELGVTFTLERAGEVHHLLDLVQRRKVAVIYGPIGPQTVRDPCLSTPKRMAAKKISFCLTSAGRSGEEDVWGQALLAVRYGLSRDAALVAVTGSPAAIVGAGRRIGRLLPGLDADVVVWSGAPLAVTSRPLAVVIDGALVHGALTPKAAAAKLGAPNKNPQKPKKSAPQRF